VFNSNKVIWKEGMFLQPQHFQQAERHLLAMMHARSVAASPHYFGVTDVAIDRDALSNDLVSLSKCAGVLPDGFVFDIPKTDMAPPARSFKDHLTAQQQTLEVYLALPLSIEGRANVLPAQAAAATAARFRSRTTQVADDVDGSTKKEIELGSAGFTILFGGESLDDYATLRIARLARNPNGQVILAESHIPPLLQIGASPCLLNDLRGVLQIFMARITALSQGRKQVEGGFAEFSSGEETAFRLLQTLNTYTPLLAHYHFTPTVHPWELYCLLSRLTGSLCTFSAQVSISDLPRYDHLNLAGTFGGMVKAIRSILEADISAGCVTIAVQQSGPATFMCKIPDERLFAGARFYLGISAKVSEKELIVGVVQRVKMASRERLDLLISSAMPGLQLMHVSNPPEGLSTKPGFLYFSLDQQGQFWENIKSSGSVAYYFPNNFQNLQMELLALKQ